MKDWFVVDRKGLAELQAGKPKHYIIRELIQNALDEPIKECRINVSFEKGMTTIEIIDDSPIGFRDLTDSYTLFKHTYKRADPSKRGRFNLGEKQSFSICDYARIKTTKGTVIFDKDGRHESSEKTETGTIVLVKVKTSQKEFDEMIDVIKYYHIPKGIEFYFNGTIIPYKHPCWEFETELLTEIEQDNILRKTTRKTMVSLYEDEETWLYELGIPVQKIDCKYSIDVQQKIPLNADREVVSPAFLQDLYAEVLNKTHNNLDEDECSELWVRDGMKDNRIIPEAVKTVMTKRFGEKYCVANPFDPNSIDEAKANGYEVIKGSEMSKEEWGNVKGYDLIDSTSDLFGTNFTNAPRVEPDEKQKAVAELAKKIAKRLLKISISVEFVKGGQGMVSAQFNPIFGTLTFNVSALRGFFDKTLSAETIDLIVHELGHHAGNHTEHSYHECITRMAGELFMLARYEPQFFDEFEKKVAIADSVGGQERAIAD